MQVKKSYLTLLIMTNFFYNAQIEEVTIEELDEVLEEIKDYIFTHFSQKLEVEEDLDSSKKPLEDIVEIRQNFLKLIDFEQANTYIQLFKMKDFKKYLQVDQFVGNTLVNDTNIADMQSKIAFNVMENYTKTLKEISSFIDFCNKEYEVIKEREYADMPTSIIKKDLLENYEKKEALINTLIDKTIVRNRSKNILKAVALIPIHPYDKDKNRKKTNYDMAYKLKLHDINEARKNNKDNDIITQEELMFMSYEELVINFINGVDEVINTGLFADFKVQLLEAKFSYISSFSFAEAYYLDPNYKIHSNFPNREESYKNIIDTHKYASCIKNATKMIDMILNTSNNEMSDKSRFYANIYNCINIQATINLDTRESFYPEFKELIVNHPNYNNENFKAAKELIDTLVHEKNTDIKKYEKK